MSSGASDTGCKIDPVAPTAAPPTTRPPKVVACATLCAAPIAGIFAIGLKMFPIRQEFLTELLKN